MSSNMARAMATLQQSVDECMASFQPPSAEPMPSTSVERQVASPHPATSLNVPIMQTSTLGSGEDMGQDWGSSEAEEGELSDKEKVAQQDPPGL